jgi:hypothetical protein
LNVNDLISLYQLVSSVCLVLIVFLSVHAGLKGEF